ncbi:TIR domain-containing protein [Shewanella baltica]|uniref:TIR domain-containing protein n=1 Tax=Shewanella baltica TaxID=62322 RepID=UPI0032188B4A
MTKKSKISIFISYSWSDTKVADEIESDLSQFQLSLVRDVRDIEYKSSITGFMEKIRDTDFAILLLSEDYLKSKNCLKEVIHLLKEKEYKNKILPIIVGNPSIYNAEGRVLYTRHWLEEKNKLEKLINSLPATAIINEIQELKVLKSISSNINDFLNYISDIKNVTFSELKDEGYKSLIESIGGINVDHLIELLQITLNPNVDEKELQIDDWFENNTPTSDAYAIRAVVAKLKNNTLKAEANYEKAIELNAENAFALNDYAYMLFNEKREHQKAKDMLVKAIEIFPNFTVARLNLGCLLTDAFDDIESAKKQYEEIISYNPTEEKAYNNLANCYKRNSKSKANQKVICELYDKALSLNPDYIEVHLGYGSFLSEYMGEHDKALKHYDEMLRIDPKSSKLVASLKERLRKKSQQKVPRNELCPCGSGLKYKKCHGA